MALPVNEIYNPARMAASGVVKAGQGILGGFLCHASGTVSIYDGADNTGTLIVGPLAVTAGTYYPMPFGYARCYAELTGGAAGTFGFI